VQGPHYQACLDRESFLVMGFSIYLTLGFFFGFCIGKINKNLRMGWDLDDATLIPIMWTALWGSATSM
jgi:hypothetical protein